MQYLYYNIATNIYTTYIGLCPGFRALLSLLMAAKYYGRKTEKKGPATTKNE